MEVGFMKTVGKSLENEVMKLRYYERIHSKSSVHWEFEFDRNDFSKFNFILEEERVVNILQNFKTVSFISISHNNKNTVKVLLMSDLKKKRSQLRMQNYNKLKTNGPSETHLPNPPNNLQKYKNFNSGGIINGTVQTDVLSVEKSDQTGALPSPDLKIIKAFKHSLNEHNSCPKSLEILMNNDQADISPVVRLTKMSCQSTSKFYALSRFNDFSTFEKARLYLSFLRRDKEYIFDGLTKLSAEMYFESLGIKKELIEELYFMFIEKRGVDRKEAEEELELMFKYYRGMNSLRIGQIQESYKKLYGINQRVVFNSSKVYASPGRCDPECCVVV